MGCFSKGSQKSNLETNENIPDNKDIRGFPHSLVGKESACSAADPGQIPGLGRSPEEGNGNPLQYSCLQILWTEAAVHGVTKSWA